MTYEQLPHLRCYKCGSLATKEASLLWKPLSLPSGETVGFICFSCQPVPKGAEYHHVPDSAPAHYLRRWFMHASCTCAPSLRRVHVCEDGDLVCVTCDSLLTPKQVREVKGVKSLPASSSPRKAKKEKREIVML